MYRDHHGAVHSEHLCGLYYNVPYLGRLQRSYLPQVEVNVHASILAATSRTKLQQTFQNPSTTRGIREVRYAFPLYDGVSVVGFQCHVGNRLIVGQVEEKENAKKVYKEAVDRGETAGLLEQLPEASDVFTTTIGNIPPGAKVIVDIIYLGELKHDMEVDGIRFTIPTSICPRYGSISSSSQQLDGTISITVDAEMAQGSFIQQIQSPSHPIAMSMGTTSIEPDAAPSMSKASATLSLGVAHLDTDFVLQVIAKDTGIPQAILETHPTIPNQRALMATLVPKFALPPEKPEIVFVCDQSGSMGGSSMDLAKEALQVFLKSLPVGVKFNICSFGSHYDFLFPRSASYSQDTLATATRHAASLSANYGGTEMLEPLRATIEKRYKDMPLDIILLTDGEIWAQQALFDYLNAQIQDTKAPIRVFTLGIGSGVSHSLIEGIAKAGNGFAQCVQAGEKMNSKVVRMLKGALSPHVNDYTLEVKYASPPDCDFEVVEKVADSLHVALDLNASAAQTDNVSNLPYSTLSPSHANAPKQTPKKISLYDTTPVPASPPSSPADRFSHLPSIGAPKILQAPQSIPPLFSFTRSTIYLLLSPHAPTATPTSVVLRGTSSHGPLELEIPVQDCGAGETVHQLAAKKAVSELEMGRGWLACATTLEGELLKDKFEGRFSDMVEREAVRLGVQFQVAGKWTSFVAVERSQPSTKASDGGDGVMDEDWEFLEDEKAAEYARREEERRAEQERVQKESEERQRKQSAWRGGFGLKGGWGGGRGGGGSAFASQQQLQLASQQQLQPTPPPAPQLFGGYTPTSSGYSTSRAFGRESCMASPPFSNAPAPQYAQMNPPFGSSSAFGQPSSKSAGSSLFASRFDSIQAHPSRPFAAPAAATPSGFGPTSPSHAKALQDYQMGLMVLHQDNPRRLRMANAASAPTSSHNPFAPQSTSGDNDAVLENFDFDSFQAGGDFSGSFSASGASTPYDLDVPVYSGSKQLASFMPLAATASKESKLKSNIDTGLRKKGGAAPAKEEEKEDSSRPARHLKRNKRNPFIDIEAEVDDEESDSENTTPCLDEYKSTNPNNPLPQTPPSRTYSPTSPSYSPSSPLPPPPPTQQHSPQETLRLLIAHQSFNGSFPYHARVLVWLGISVADFKKTQQHLAAADTSSSAAEQTGDCLATALVVAYLEKRLADYESEWELVVEKARGWLEGEAGTEGARAWVEVAKGMV